MITNSVTSIISRQRKLIDKLEKHVISQNGNYNNNQLLLKEEILAQVSNQFNTSPNILINSKKRGIINQARVMAIILFDKHLNILQKDIAKIFKKKNSLINMRINVFNKIFKNKNIYYPQKQFEKMYSENFISIYNNINNKIIEFKKKQSL